MVTDTLPDFLVHWGDEATHARRRESTMAAGVLHLGLAILLLISPKIFTQQILSEEQAVELARQQLTVLYIPSDLLRIPEPRTPPDLTPEERRRAVLRTPFTVDPRELRRILPPPAPPSAGVPPSSEGEPSASDAGESERPEPEGEGREIARLELEDLPQPQRRGSSDLELLMPSPGRAIEESLRRGQGARGGGSRRVGTPLPPNLNTPFPLILSDTRGVDFTPYLIRLLRDVRRNWYAVIPESARWGEQGKAVIVFTIQQDGSVPLGQPTLVYSSGRSHLDRPALAAIRGSQPFPPLPEEFTGEHIVLQFTFLYNLPVDYTGP